MIRRTVQLVMFYLIWSAGVVQAWNYPSDGYFKQLPAKADPWFYTDDRWDIRCPDKFQHSQGSQVACELINGVVQNRALTLFIVAGAGVYKEYGDAFREGWSPRDLEADGIGIASWIFNKSMKSTKITFYYDSWKFQMRVSFVL